LENGVGFAIAERFLAERYNRPSTRSSTTASTGICSDGDLMEGSRTRRRRSPHQRLASSSHFYRRPKHHDRRHDVDLVHEDRAAAFVAQGWHVQLIEDANDLRALRAAIANAQRDCSASMTPLARNVRLRRSSAAVSAAHSRSAARSALRSFRVLDELDVQPARRSVPARSSVNEIHVMPSIVMLLSS